MTYDVDLFVIGAGSGGVRAARIAARHGARAMIAEADRVGGTCVIRGCVPKKLMVVASRFADAFYDSAGYGWTHGEAHFNWTTLVERTQREVSRLEGLYRGNLEASGAKLVSGRATVVNAHTVLLQPTGERITARNILVATGGRPVVPDIPGAEHLLTSNDFFTMPSLPRTVCVVGGGYIAVELAGMLQAMGSKVTLIHRGSSLLQGFDTELQQELIRSYRERGLAVELGAALASVKRDGGNTLVRTVDGRTFECEVAIAATGRVPATDGLGLREVGVAIDAQGAITVDADSRTAVPSIFAVGDATNRINLTPVAVREGHAVADMLFGPSHTPMDHSNVATAVFSTPEIGTVGPSEAVARTLYPGLRVFRSSFRPLAAALTNRPERVTMKLLVDGARDRLVGAHLIGHESAELIQLLAVAIKGGLTKAQLDATVAVHPSLAEELVTMRREVPSPAATSAV